MDQGPLKIFPAVGGHEVVHKKGAQVGGDAFGEKVVGDLFRGCLLYTSDVAGVGKFFSEECALSYLPRPCEDNHRMVPDRFADRRENPPRFVFEFMT